MKKASIKNPVPAHYRQGDVLIERIDALPSGIKLKEVPREGGRVILAHGEVTGHAHAICEPKVKLFADPGEKREDGLAGVTYLEIRQAVADLQHDEHDTIPLAGGTYRVTRQREYTPEAIRQVAD